MYVGHVLRVLRVCSSAHDSDEATHRISHSRGSRKSWGTRSRNTQSVHLHPKSAHGSAEVFMLPPTPKKVPKSWIRWRTGRLKVRVQALLRKV